MDCHATHDNIKARISSFDHEIENTHKEVTLEFWEYYKLMLQEAESRHLIYCEVPQMRNPDLFRDSINLAKTTMKTYSNTTAPKIFN